MKQEYRMYEKDTLVATRGERGRIGIVIKGTVLSAQGTDGYESIPAERWEEGGLFGTEAVFSTEGIYPTNLFAGTECTVLFFDLREPLEQMELEVRIQLASNVAHVVADHSRELLHRLAILSAL